MKDSFINFKEKYILQLITFFGFNEFFFLGLVNKNSENKIKLGDTSTE